MTDHPRDRALPWGSARCVRLRQNRARLDGAVGVAEWFLSASGRGNPATELDLRRDDGLAWSAGNAVTPLIHGEAYLPELLRCVRLMQSGDLLLFTDWRGDPDELLDGAGSEVSQVLCQAASRGVVVKGLVWRSHLDRFALPRSAQTT
jgi:hypothetical protein